jgi:hypothetical protein
LIEPMANATVWAKRAAALTEGRTRMPQQSWQKICTRWLCTGCHRMTTGWKVTLLIDAVDRGRLGHLYSHLVF